MYRIVLTTLFALFFKLLYAQSIPPIGQWRDHLPMRNIIGLEDDDGILVATTAYGYFTYDPTARSFRQMTRSSGLSEVSLKLMRKDPSSSKKILVYHNSNIDIVDGDKTINIPDVFKSTTQEDKTVFDALWVGDDIYLSTGLGIVVVNVQRYEIRDTYRLGSNGRAIKVNALALFQDTLYAATEEGLKKAPFQVTQLRDFRNWVPEQIGSTSKESGEQVIVWNQQLLIRKKDSLFTRNHYQWDLFHTSSLPITRLSVDNNILYVLRSSQGIGSIQTFNATNNTSSIIQTPSMVHPMDCKELNGQLWVGDSEAGLLKIDGAADEIIVPNSPYGIAKGDAIYLNDQIWVSSGSVDEYWRPKNNKQGISQFNGDKWNNYHSSNNSMPDSVADIISLALDPSTESLYAGSFGGGLVELNKEGKINIYKQSSPISSSILDPEAYRVSGLAFDQQMALWVSNYGAEKNLLAKTREGIWKGFVIPFAHQDNAVSSIVVDDLNRKWIVAPRGGGLFCLDDNRTIDQVNDDRWRQFRAGRGSGNLPSSNVRCIAADRNGFVWVGTDKGIAIIQCGEDLFNAGLCEATIPVVQQGNFAGPLFSNETINDIEVDGADRKWIATNQGVWLVGADGQKTIFSFNQSNSPLLSNIVHAVVVHKKTGEVFFLTENGICSFRNTATEPVTEKSKPIVFPNPVPPGYAGTIAIRELPNNAWVRITELDGRLVHQTRSVGGQAIWNGKNYKGERVSSGVYLVYISDELNTQRVAAKIFFIK